MFNVPFIAAILVSYFIGNISPAIIIGKIMGVEIRSKGSGNAGTTNVLRVLGKKAAVATLVIDILKGVVAVLIGKYVGGLDLAMICGAAALIGHIWPAIFGFRGGKGIATAFGVLLMVEPLLGIFELVVAASFMLISKRVSVGSLVAAVALPIAAGFFNQDYILWTGIMAVIVIFKHRLNISRLLKGEEPKLSFKKREGANE